MKALRMDEPVWNPFPSSPSHISSPAELGPIQRSATAIFNTQRDVVDTHSGNNITLSQNIHYFNYLKLSPKHKFLSYVNVFIKIKLFYVTYAKNKLFPISD